MPGVWESAGIEEVRDYDGFAWYRIAFRAGSATPTNNGGDAIVLELGHLDDCDETFFDGVKVGATGLMPPDDQSGTDRERRYPIPADLWNAKTAHVIAVRVYDHGGKGGFKRGWPRLACGDHEIDLCGAWRFCPGDAETWSRPLEGELDDAGERAWTLRNELSLDSWRRKVETGSALTPDEALRAFEVLDGFEVKAVAHEPQIRQTVEVQFDARGRMWVVQYLQYMYPAGLTPLKKDEWDRTVYDRVPEPPPHGPRGLDRITICEDSDRDGTYESFHDFVDGLNLATSVAIGHGGVFVAQTPYLLFYPDRDQDDVPDGPPDVLLSGFGMEDAHAVVNSLTFGPDGWLYGAQGSTCNADIGGVIFQQGAWRYHPETGEFELFAQGGGNTFGLEFDSAGELLTGTNWGDFTMVHYVQGGYYFKNFSKHGELSNPHAYGFYPHCRHEGEAVGHVAHVGVIEQGGLFPDELRGAWIMPHLLGNRVCIHDVIADGSSFATRHRAHLIATADSWFRPVDVTTGPEGALYIADWYDQRATHLIPKDTWHKETGRIYRVTPKGRGRTLPIDLRSQPSDELVELLAHPNAWFRRQARLILDERDDRTVYRMLKERIVQPPSGLVALEALWALHSSGGLDAELARMLLDHPLDRVRSWTARLLCDQQQVTETVARKLAAMAGLDESVHVRRQLACSARRLPAEQSSPIVRALLVRDEDAADPHIPLALWWAVEDKVGDLELLTRHLGEPSLFDHPLAREVVLPRLVRRLLSCKDSGKDSSRVPRFASSEAPFEEASGLGAARLFVDCCPPEAATLFLTQIDEGLKGRHAFTFSPELTASLQNLVSRAGDPELPLRVALRLDSHRALPRALQALETSPDEKHRIEIVELLAEIRARAAISNLEQRLAGDPSLSVRKAAALALSAFQGESAGAFLISALRSADTPSELRGSLVEAIGRRPQWVHSLLDAVERGEIAKDSLPGDQVQRFVLHGDGAIDAAVDRNWGPAIRPAEDKARRIDEIRRLLVADSGERAPGREVFQRVCANCHRLFGEGRTLAPDLTDYERHSLEGLLISIVDPSLAIREGYENHIAATEDGRLVNGLLVERTPDSLTLDDGEGGRTTLAGDEILKLRISPTSRMPEGLLDALSPAEIRDLFAYLQSR